MRKVFGKRLGGKSANNMRKKLRLAGRDGRGICVYAVAVFDDAALYERACLARRFVGYLSGGYDVAYINFTASEEAQGGIDIQRQNVGARLLGKIGERTFEVEKPVFARIDDAFGKYAQHAVVLQDFGTLTEKLQVESVCFDKYAFEQPGEETRDIPFFRITDSGKTNFLFAVQKVNKECVEIGVMIGDDNGFSVQFIFCIAVFFI